MASISADNGVLRDYLSDAEVRPATREEWQASKEAAAFANAAHVDLAPGVIVVDGRWCYVSGGPARED